MAIDTISGIAATTDPAAAIEPVAPIAARTAGGGTTASTAQADTPPLLGRASDPTTGTTGAPPTPAQTHAAVAAANKQLGESGREFSFHYDDQVHQTIVKIIDTQTQQVLQQIPSEAMLAAARALASGSTSGLLLKTKV